MLSSEAAEMKALTALSSTSRAVLPRAAARAVGDSARSKRAGAARSVHSASNSEPWRHCLVPQRS